jgi:hypothetical protein
MADRSDSHDVRKILHNCNAHGRTAAWREKRRGLLKPPIIPDQMQKRIYELLKITHGLTTGYYPETDGQQSGKARYLKSPH